MASRKLPEYVAVTAEERSTASRLIRRFRHVHQKTQAEIAAMLDCDRPAIGKLERASTSVAGRIVKAVLDTIEPIPEKPCQCTRVLTEIGDHDAGCPAIAER